MPNTNTNTAVELYSNKFIEGLTKALAPLRAFSLDLSDVVKEPGDQLSASLHECFLISLTLNNR